MLTVLRHTRNGWARQRYFWPKVTRRLLRWVTDRAGNAGDKQMKVWEYRRAQREYIKEKKDKEGSKGNRRKSESDDRSWRRGGKGCDPWKKTRLQSYSGYRGMVWYSTVCYCGWWVCTATWLKHEVMAFSMLPEITCMNILISICIIIRFIVPAELFVPGRHENIQYTSCHCIRPVLRTVDTP